MSPSIFAAENNFTNWIYCRCRNFLIEIGKVNFASAIRCMVNFVPFKLLLCLSIPKLLNLKTQRSSYSWHRHHCISSRLMSETAIQDWAFVLISCDKSVAKSSGRLGSVFGWVGSPLRCALCPDVIRGCRLMLWGVWHYLWFLTLVLGIYCRFLGFGKWLCTVVWNTAQYTWFLVANVFVLCLDTLRF